MVTESQMNVRVSVRNFVEFLLRSGDIDNRRGAFKERDAMAEGSRLHKKIQGRMGVEYAPEVTLHHEICFEDMTLTIEGRADGIITPREEDGPIVIDEIKCVYRKLSYITEPEVLHLAQAKVYGYIYALQKNLEEIQIRISYCNIDTEEMKYFYETFTVGQLSKWFQQLLMEYKKWMDDSRLWRLKRNESIEQVVFPFPYRKGQKSLQAMVYQNILEKKRLYIQAPTGTGKTLISLYPAIKSVGKGNGEKIFYLTAKTITRKVAKETMELLKEEGLEYRVLVLTAKEKICFLEDMECNPVHCPYAKGHFDRVNEAVFDLITTESMYTREVIEEYAKRYQVCPFEMGLDVSLWADCIICDYNYVFDPNVYLKRFFQEGVKGDYIFLIDEVHNLLDRGREMYSALLIKEEFSEVKNYVKDVSRKLAGRLESCNRHLLEYKRECEKCRVVDSISAFVVSLLRLQSEIEKFMDKDELLADKQPLLDLYLKVRHFLNMYELAGDNYINYTQHMEDGKFQIKLFCVDPSLNIKECLERGRSAVLFSATLLPIKYYKSLLTEEEDGAVYAESPFDSRRLCVLAATDVSSKYSRRNQNEYDKIAFYIKETICAKAGNYLVFFPSYAYMEQVYHIYQSNYAETEQLKIQWNDMTEKDREEFLSAFEQQKGSLVGFCVMGGIFSEGIDLKAERLIGSIIVGTGLPGIGNERELLKAYFDQQGKKGFDYAYRFPGINKVLQAAGRVIRTEHDRGVVLLLDERFGSREYQGMYPREWAGLRFTTSKQVRFLLEEFWKTQEEKGEEY
ncbi:MAG: ATP-dependent DNA helicase [Lachnospiraceae bacterium]|nr:ATP-dependent DNA helicase [Lachnospiraceae bacterium]